MKTLQLIEKISQGDYNETFGKLYGTAQNIIDEQQNRYINAIRAFADIYGSDRDVNIYSAPGRTEIGGNHTDHNNGIVMAAAVNLDIIAVVSKNSENVVRLKSKGFDSTDKIILNVFTPQEKETGHSASLIRGIATGFKNIGGNIGGFDAYTSSAVLRGSGLSSSAAFEVIVGEILNSEYNNCAYSAVEIAKISQYAENVFFDKPSGLMDQTACAVGGAITIDFKNPTEPIVNKVNFSLEKHDFSLCITDTKGSHADLTDDYTAIRREMESIAEYYGKKVLRDVDSQAVYNDLAILRAKFGDRAVLRTIHFFAECKRAVALCDALKEDRLGDFLEMIIEGGHSSFECNQNAYSIKNPAEQGIPLALTISKEILSGRGAWRLQGGGFAGTIQAFVPNDLLNKYVLAINNIFGEGSCYVLSVRNFGAVKVENKI